MGNNRLTGAKLRLGPFVAQLLLAAVLGTAHAEPVLPAAPQAAVEANPEKSAALQKADQLYRSADQADDEHRNADAARWSEEALKIYRSTLGPEDIKTMAAQTLLASSYGKLGRHAEALKLREDTLATLRRTLGPEHLNTLRTMTNVSVSLSAVGRFAESLKLEEETLAIMRRTLGAEHPDTLRSMANLAVSYGNLGRNADALKLREETQVIMRRTLGPEHPDTLTSMNNLANSYGKVGRNADALKLREETLAIRRRTLGPEHPDTLTSMNNLAASYSDLGRFTEALKLEEETLSIRRRTLGAEHPLTLVSMINLANSYGDLGRNAEALKLNEETLAIRRRTLGAEHPDTLGSMASVANNYYLLGRYAEAIKLNEETLVIRRRTLGPEHPNTLASMNNLAVSYGALGRDAEALKLREETLAIRRRTLGAEHPDTLISMANLTISYSALGRTAEALKLNEETVAIRCRTLGPDHPKTLASMNNLAFSYSALGRHAEALKLEEETLAIRRRTLGAEHPDTLGSMANLAVSYSDLGRVVEALKLNEETLAIRRRTLGAEHPETLRSMVNLATNYRALGRNAEALKLKEETLTIMRRTLGAEHPHTLASMGNLAVSYSDLGRHAEALKLNEETLAIKRRTLGPEHPDTLVSINNLAVSYSDLGRRPDSLALRRESLAVIDRLADSFTALTRDERSTALAQYQGYYTRFAQALADDPKDYAEAFAVTERGKARSLLEELTARQAISSSGIPSASGQRMADLRNRIEALDGKLVLAANDDTRQALRSQRDAAKAELQTLRAELMTTYPRYAALSAVAPVSLEQGRALLPAQGVYVAWLFDDAMSGVALALPKTGALRVIKSAPGKALLTHAESYRWLHALPDSVSFRKALQQVPLAAWLDGGVLAIGSRERKPADASDVAAADYPSLRQAALDAHGKWLAEQLLQPLADEIGDAGQWIVSPDGVLATLPWDSLPWHGKPLGEQKQLTVIQSLSVYQLLKTREAEYAQKRPGQTGPDRPLLAMGGALYSKEVSAVCDVRGGNKRNSSFRRAPEYTSAPASSAAAEQQNTDAYAQMQRLDWPNLPCTEREANALHGLLGGTVLLGGQASETALRQLSQSGELARYRNLHFAAHGYLNSRYPNLSALVLTKTGGDEASDGFITAGEWPAFDLRSDLMVMSACETGLGRTVGGEGVQGLPYALYVAGNRDTLLSLWQVSDAGTSVFMRRFWAKVKAGSGHALALSETKREMRRGDDGKTYTDPYYWAPFVLYGLQE